jgi:hypothetical protein
VFLCHLAAVHELGGDVHQAALVAAAAARIARQTGSARLREMLLPVHGRLAVRSPDDPDVADLAEALR